MTTPTVYTVTLSWNRKADTLECLRSIVTSDYPDVRIILIDNASTDGTVAAVHSELPEVLTVVNSVNLGYAAGINVGLQKALDQGADFVSIVDNDAVLASDALSQMVAVAQARPTVGLLTPKILYYDDPGVVWFAGHRRQPVTLDAVGGSMGMLDSNLNGDPRPMDYAPCCGLLIRRAVLENIGLLAKCFFIYYEDLDFCIRAQQSGFRLLNVPQAKVWHKVSASAGEGSPLQKYYLARSSVHFFSRHASRWLSPLVVLYRLGSAIRTVGRALQHRRPDVASAYYRGLRDGIAEVFGGVAIPKDEGLR